MREKIGFFGGTFDPIHFGHISLAISLMEAHQLDQVWFCPAQISPFKQENHPLSPQQRVEMVRLAIDGIPQFCLIEDEIQRQGPSYTIDTIMQLIATYPDKQFFLMLGDDMAAGFANWHQAEELARLVPLLVGQRGESRAIEGSAAIRSAIERGRTPTPLMAISATEVRQRLKKKLYCGHLVPAKVLDFIHQNRLY
jgi:nicotinate-nucleotide adenylyltransferase